ncbi:hypothetical protein GCM10010451_15800 [Streptomyces virens]|uniref:Integral membrane protein n=1 Tax=Streptomyces virens TaxID=285572 RepID=A0ABP6P5N5_9ACTN|nr:hypothetical protein [Streptomyces calvus]
MSSADIVVGEGIGTAILIPFGAGVVAAVVLNHSKTKDAGWVVIAPGWGFGVMAGAYTAAPLSGGARHRCVERPRRAEVPLAEGRRVAPAIEASVRGRAYRNWRRAVDKSLGWTQDGDG